MDNNNDLFIDNTNSKNNNIILIFFGLFIFWEYFPNYFQKFEVKKLKTLLLYCNI